jgi:general secretion pathway protein A
MYENYYGFKIKPFSLQPEPSFLYMGERHGTAFTMLDYGVFNRAPITVITGEIGSGKTTLIHHLLNSLNEDVAVGLISNTHKAFGELLTWVCLAFNLDYEGKDKATMYQLFIDFMIDQYAKGKRTVLIVDEAQNLGADLLEELRVISNVNADKDQILQLILVGQPELRETLRRPELEQLAQRVSVDYHIDSLEPEETDAYISHRLEVAGGNPDLFEPIARRFIHYHSDGIPRLINNLCDTALVYGFATQLEKINEETIYEVIQDKIKNGGGLLVNRRRKQTLSEFEPELSKFNSLYI